MTSEKKKQLIDLSYLEATFGNNPLAISKVLDSFLSNTPQLMDNLFSNAKNSNWEEVKMIAHKMKSSFKMIGALQIANALEEIEHLSLSKTNEPKVFLSIKEVHALGKKVCSEVEEKLND